MSDGVNRSQLSKYIFLGVLLVGLAGSVTYMIRTINQQGARKNKPVATKQAARPSRAQQEKGSDAKFTETPIVAGVGRADGELPQTGPTGMNLNMFKVFDLNPPRNPFVQEEKWYAQNFEEQLPGYPELKDDEYFESDKAFIPDIWNLIEGEEEWESFSLKRELLEHNYKFTGTSEDQEIETTLNLEAPKPDAKNYVYDPSIGMSLQDYMDPNWEANRSGAGQVFNPPDNGDLFTPPSDGLDGLDHPGGGVPHGTGGMGDEFYCRGVNIRASQLYALLEYNGIAYIVQQDTMLPPKYKVQEIQKNGVILFDLRREMSIWVPLAAPAGAQTNTFKQREIEKPKLQQAPSELGGAGGAVPMDLILQQLFPMQ